MDSLRSLLRAAFGLLLLTASPGVAQTIVSSTETSPQPGIRIRELRTTGPTTRAWAAFIDLCAASVHVDATTAPTSLRTTGSMGATAGAQLAVNGDFYKTGPVRVYGDAVGGGVRWPLVQTGVDPGYGFEWFYRNYGWIAFGRDWVEFSHTEYVKNNAAALGVTQGFKPTTVTTELPEGTLALVSGFPELVVEGAPHTCPVPTASNCFPDRGDMSARHPRTAMGLTEDRRTLILLVVDGRTSLSSGMLGTELANLMAQLGAWVAFNLDGGGSSQMWLAGSGYLNDVNGNNLGNGARAMANHWAIFAGAANGKAKKPGHCVDYLAEATVGQARHDQRPLTDLDGDGKADACVRTASGVRCARGGALGQELSFSMLSDADGWNDAALWPSVRLGDLDADGRADLCARDAAGVRCWRSGAQPLSTVTLGPAMTNAGGWGGAAYASTLRLADFNADGKDDLCARAASGFRCYPSTGAGFGAAVTSTVFSDADGFADADNFGSLRMGDVDGDGRMDVCGRADTGMQCALSTGTGFATPVAGPAWSDASGWAALAYWSSIRLADVNGDGKADLCARGSSGFRCHLSTGSGFGAASPVVTDVSTANGWSAPSRSQTLRLGDVDGDGDLDLCGRDAAGIRCWPWTGAGFGAAFAGPALTDAAGWDQQRFFSTLRLADVSGDGRADLCARDGQRLRCWLSTGAGFGPRVDGPAWAGVGFEEPAVWGTLQVGGPRCLARAEVCNGVDDDCDGQVDEGCVDAGAPDAGAVDAGVADAGAIDAGVADAGGVFDAGVADAGADLPDAGDVADAGDAADAGAAPDAGDDTPDAGLGAGGGTGGEGEPLPGCGCTAAPPPLASLALLLALLGRRRRSSAATVAARLHSGSAQQLRD